MTATTADVPRTDEGPTTMHPLRLSLRVPLRTPLADLEPVLGVLHRFIQRGWVEGAVLDVADYRHVPQGPGVLLVGHDVDYGITSDALTVTRKRSRADATTQCVDLLRMAATAVEALAYDGTLDVDVDLGDVTVQLLDRRLAAELGDEAGQALADAVAGALAAAWGGSPVLSPSAPDDPRHVHEVRVVADGVTAADVLERLGGSLAPMQSPHDVPVEELAAALEDGSAVVLDVREETELATATLGGVHVPLAELEERLDELDRDARILVHCRAGLRGAKAVAILRGNGFADAWNVNGALVAWSDRIDASFPRY